MFEAMSHNGDTIGTTENASNSLFSFPIQLCLTVGWVQPPAEASVWRQSNKICLPKTLIQKSTLLFNLFWEYNFVKRFNQKVPQSVFHSAQKTYFIGLSPEVFAQDQVPVGTQATCNSCPSHCKKGQGELFQPFRDKIPFLLLKECPGAGWDRAWLAF